MPMKIVRFALGAAMLALLADQIAQRVTDVDLLAVDLNFHAARYTL